MLGFLKESLKKEVDNKSEEISDKLKIKRHFVRFKYNPNRKYYVSITIVLNKKVADIRCILSSRAGIREKNLKKINDNKFFVEFDDLPKKINFFFKIECDGEITGLEIINEALLKRDKKLKSQLSERKRIKTEYKEILKNLNNEMSKQNKNFFDFVTKFYQGKKQKFDKLKARSIMYAKWSKSFLIEVRKEIEKFDSLKKRLSKRDEMLLFLIAFKLIAKMQVSIMVPVLTGRKNVKHEQKMRYFYEYERIYNYFLNNKKPLKFLMESMQEAKQANAEYIKRIKK